MSGCAPLHPHTNMNCQVCIIGAGVAGLKAAQELVDGGVPASQIIILEAQDRVGGRIKTISSGTHHYDLGASWFHDFLTNCVLHENIADGTLVPLDGYFDDKLHMYFSQHGLVDAQALKLEQVRHDIEQYIQLHFTRAVDVPDVSLVEIVQAFFARYGAFLEPEQRRYCGHMMRYLELWFGITSDNISAKYAALNHTGRNFFNRKGFSFLTDKLSRGLDIRLNEHVSRIERRGLPRIHSTSGVYFADYVIVTVPQSVLALDEAHDYGITWSPPLPAPMRQAINDVHFGALGKVIMEFDEVFWPLSQDRMELIATKMPGNPDTPLPFEYPLLFVNQVPISGAKSLVCLVQSPLTDYLERNPHRAWEYMRPVLEHLVQPEQANPSEPALRKGIPDPVNIIVTDWTLNPYTRGLYTAVHVNDDPSGCLIHLSGEYDMCGLGAGSKIRFAGEHTIADGAGCVHGAYQSGRRAAQWILQDMGLSSHTA